MQVSTINSVLRQPLTKPVAFLTGLLPLVWLAYAAVFDHLGANPAEALIRATGDWTLRLLCVVLAITPIRTMTGVHSLASYRRMVGLFVYFYAVMHLLSYAGFDMAFDVADIATDIVKRPFILVGFTAVVVLSLLAGTSFNRAIRWMGSKRWQQLHRSVYLVAILAVVHFFWMRAGKNNFTEVGIYAAILAVLLGWRAWRAFKLNRSQGH